MRPNSSPTDQAPALATLLGRERAMRLRMGQQMLSLALVLTNGLILGYAVRFGGAPYWAWALWFGVALVFQVAMALAIRLGRTAHRPDPTCAATQIGVMLLLGATAYLLAGQQRALILPLMITSLAFGMFARCGRTMFRLSGLGLLLLLAAIGLDARMGPGPDRAAENLGHALVALTSFPALALLTLRMARLRERHWVQRQELQAALKHIQRMARRDELTGLYNRHRGKRLMLKALQRQRRVATGLMVVVLDIDHFKKINDTHGHPAGDAVLRCFAQALTTSLRKGDVAIRWGGEEFLAVLEATTREGLVAWLARLQLDLERQPLLSDRPELRFTFSGGAAFWRPDEGLEAWLERADQALYRAKAEGRDRVLTAP